ncbi:hypothetical protein NIES22_12440 [Calothrix brevissima NIES-22]|nr:hypothetical protein NIES22_12440 [Calothrix brevissima NIES-22]
MPKQANDYTSFSFCNKNILAQHIGYSSHTLKAIRQRGEWIEGIHYVRENSRTIRYNLALCLNWLANKHNPDAHQKEIARYLASLEVQKTRKGKR